MMITHHRNGQRRLKSNQDRLLSTPKTAISQGEQCFSIVTRLTIHHAMNNQPDASKYSCITSSILHLKAPDKTT